LFNVFVTNGYTEIKPVKKISKYLDAVVIDLKGFNSGYYEKVIKGNLEKIKSAVLEYKKNNVWVEISNLVIEGINDSNEDMKEMCRWISSELGKNIPLHIIGFYPSYLMKKTKPAGIGRIKEIYSIAKSYGLKYAYARFEDKFDTKCTKCGRTAVARSLYDFSVMENNTDNGRCVFCGAQADIKV